MTDGSLIWIGLLSTLAAFVTATATKVVGELSWHELEEYCRLRKMPDRFDEIHGRADSVASTTETLQILFSIGALLAWSGLLLVV